MERALDPRERDYRLGEVDSVIVKDEDKSDLVKAKVVGFEPDGSRRPIFVAVTPPCEGRELHWWHISFT